MLLLPQRSGHLMYPTVDVKCFESGTEKEIRCEIDYQSQARSILVIPGLKSTTVAIDEDAAAGNSLLVSTESMSTDR
jgi:Trafficking protein particle complex subunit 10, TRAPPC10